jgi:hypothetical protein
LDVVIYFRDPQIANPLLTKKFFSYYATYLEAFEPQPLYLAFIQFLSLKSGAIVWWGGILGAFVLIADHVKTRRWRPWEDPCAWAFALSAIIIIIVVSDMLLVGYPGSSESVVRYSRYRQIVVPLLAVVAVWGLSALLQRFSAAGPGVQLNTPARTATAGVASALVLVITCYNNSVQNALPSQLRKETILAQFQQMFVLSDRAVFEHNNPGAIAVLRHLQERWLALSRLA